MYYVTPSEGELFKRFSPDLQKRNLEARERRTAEYLDFAGKMREYSKSDKPIWEAAEEAQRKKRAEMIEVDRARMMEEERVKSEMREAQREEMRR
jgi:CBP4